MMVQGKSWTHASIGAGNLSELEMTQGRLTDAVADARQAIIHANQSGDAFQRMSKRTTAADALHQSGQRAEAGTLFAEAERMQKVFQPEFDLLYSLWGFRYCDWLLAPAERAAWQAVLGSMGVSLARNPHGQEDHATTCDEVERRGNKMFEWRLPHDSLLDIALDHLTLARTGLVREVLTHALPQAMLGLPHVAAAVNGLRKTGIVDHLPQGLLTAALYHFVRGENDLARRSLAEAQQIAERGPMPLHLADVHLHRARMFRDTAELAKARQLIEQCGYWRRKEELEDAEAAAAHW
jgi:hypothetical protein